MTKKDNLIQERRRSASGIIAVSPVKCNNRELADIMSQVCRYPSLPAMLPLNSSPAMPILISEYKGHFRLETVVELTFCLFGIYDVRAIAKGVYNGIYH